MRRIVFIALLCGINLCNFAWAQAPVISYAPSAFNLPQNAPATITPTNSGGAVSSTGSTTTATYIVSTLATGLGTPWGLTTDGLNLYIATGRVIEKIDIATGTATVFAGDISSSGGADNAVGLSATFYSSTGITYDGSRYLYVCEYNSFVIRRIDLQGTNPVVTIAGVYNASGEIDGSGTIGAVGGARFNQPMAITYDAVSNSLFVADAAGSTIRKIAITGTAPNFTYTTTTITSILNPLGIAYDGTSLYVATSSGNFGVYRIEPATGVKTLVAGPGNGAGGNTDGTGTAARFGNPYQLVYDASSNSLYVADFYNNTIRKITLADNVVTTVMGSGSATEADGVGTAAALNGPVSITSGADGALYVDDYNGGNVRSVAVSGYTISPALPAGLSFNNATGVISGTPTASSTLTIYTVTGYNAWGYSKTALTITIPGNYNWTGATSSAWDVAGNWSPAMIPGAADNVSIGAATYTNQPAVGSAVTPLVTAVGTLTFGSTQQATMTVATASSLTINNSLTINAGATPGITGTGTAAINMAPASVVSIDNTGTLALTAPLAFTLQSSASGDASIGPLVSAAQITGTAASNINVERYISGERGYRLLSSPVYAAAETTTGNTVNAYSINYLLNNTFITGSGGVAGGFSQSGNPTAYLFRENMTPLYTSFTNSNFRAFADLSSSPLYTFDVDGGPYYIPAGNGYLFFFRGDKTLTVNPYSPSSTASATTVTATGMLNIGPVQVTNWFTPGAAGLSYTAASPLSIAGFNLVGNPYPSAIDWDTFQTTSSTTGIYGSNVTNFMYVLDPVSKAYGVYQAGFGGVGSAAFVSNIIASGQAFFVIAGAPGAQLIFNESAKTSSSNTGAQLLMGTPVAGPPIQYLRLQMGSDLVNNEQTLIRLHKQATFAFDASMDAGNRPGFGTVSLSSTSSDKKALSIYSVPFPTAKTGDVIKLNINASTDGIYTLSLTKLVAIPAYYDIWLMDAQKQDSLEIRYQPAYKFNIDHNDTTTFGGNRFTLVIRENPAFAYRLLGFNATKVAGAKQVQTAWKTENEENYTYFTVERSNDGGKTYNAAGSVPANAGGAYSFVDKNPQAGDNLYRLKQDDVNNAITYSNAVTVQFSPQGNSLADKSQITFYPNPTSSTVTMTIGVPVAQASTYTVQFLNSNGMVVKEATTNDPAWTGSVGNLLPGTYVIQVTNNKEPLFLLQSKLVKL